MTSVKDKTGTIRVCVVSIALGIAFGSVITSLERFSAQNQKASVTTDSSKRMADGKQWTTHNLEVNIWPFVYVGVGAARMSIIGGWMAIADGRRVAADGEALRWRQRGFG